MCESTLRHPLEIEYRLTAYELLDALSGRFRAKVALEGAVAEVHLGKHISALLEKGKITSFEEHDQDGYPDFTITLHTGQSLTIECKNVRDAKEAYRLGGEVVAYKVETQKTRASTGDPSSRFYDRAYFGILAVCLGKKTGDWTQFLFIRSKDLAPHKQYPGKLAAMQRVPLPASGGTDAHRWYHSLGALVESGG